MNWFKKALRGDCINCIAMPSELVIIIGINTRHVSSSIQSFVPISIAPSLSQNLERHSVWVSKSVSWWFFPFVSISDLFHKMVVP